MYTGGLTASALRFVGFGHPAGGRAGVEGGQSVQRLQPENPANPSVRLMWVQTFVTGLRVDGALLPLGFYRNQCEC
jgi:hypothetical protein